MDNTNNINGFRSVYMAFGVFKTGANDARVKTENGENPKFLSALSVAANKIRSDDNSLSADENELINPVKNGQLNSNDGAFLSYTRIITAKVPDDIAAAMNNKEDTAEGSEFDLTKGGQELQITIKVSGNNRIYTASGVDKDGNTFTKDIDPYDVDPTDTDYAGFAALCSYIRDTEGLADNAMQAVRDAAPDDITERGNYLFKVSYASEGAGNLSGAKKLFEQMETFFEKLMSIGNTTAAFNDSNSNVVNVSSNGTQSGSSSSSGSFHSKVLDELQELIEQMLQKMLNEIMGIDDSSDIAANTEENSEIATQEITEGNGYEEASEITNESAIKIEEGTEPESNSLEESLGVENAVAL